MTLYDQLFKMFIDLDTFSRLPVYTHVHLSKSGHFVPTAGKLASLPGAQLISNYINNYTPTQLCIDLQTFANHLIDLLTQLDDNDPLLTLAYHQCQLAMGNETVGLSSLTITYPQHDVQLLNIINFLNTRITLLYKQDLKYHLTDEQWQLLMNNSLYLQYETTSFYKFYILYSTSLIFNHVMSITWHWFDVIHTFDNSVIMLGGMPLKASIIGFETRNDLITLYDNGIKAVLSVVECFENTSTGFIYSPIQPHEWAPYDIQFLQVPIPDFCEVSLEKIKTCVEYIHWCVQQNKSIYIHCRVGKNRSVLVLAAYFIKYLKMTSQQAFNYIQNQRMQVQNGHYKTLQLYESTLQ
jgi:protein-tyrosine phosphatase